MAQIRIPVGYLEVVFESECEAAVHPVINVWGCAYDILADLTDIETQLNTAAAELWDSALTSTTLVQTTIRLGQVTAPYPTVTYSSTHAGTVGGDPSPGNVAALLKKSTLDAGRQGRGRSYLCGFLSDAGIEDNSTLTSGVQISLLAAAGGMLGLMQTGDLQGAVILHPEGSPLAETPSLLTGISVDPMVATQRRRIRP